MNDSILAAVAYPLVAAMVLLVATGCIATPQVRGTATFESVRPLLEANCVHCHGGNRLPSMPGFPDTKALAALIGPGKLIVPGDPGRSRFFQVIALADTQAAAMPPTGHAVSKTEVEILRAWIQGGAPLPAGNVALKRRGIAPRSR